MPIQIPIGAEDQFKGVIDLVTMQALTFDEGDKGFNVIYGEIPAELRAEAEKWREHMVEMVAETDEHLMEDRKSTRLNSSHNSESRMPSSA
jgi:elongation factor G